jgi:hypothetical protein
MLSEMEASSTGAWPCAGSGYHQPSKRCFEDNVGIGALWVLDQ